MCQTILSHSNSFGIEMEIDTAGCRAYHLNLYCRSIEYLFHPNKNTTNTQAFLESATMYVPLDEHLRVLESTNNLFRFHHTSSTNSSHNTQTYLCLEENQIAYHNTHLR